MRVCRPNAFVVATLGTQLIGPTLSGSSGDVEGIVRDGLKHFAKHEVMEGKDGPPIQQAE
jgi:hypothetical protein